MSSELNGEGAAGPERSGPGLDSARHLPARTPARSTGGRRRRRALREPLVHIGYHKTATTWLQKELLDRSEFGFTSPWGRERILDDWVRVDPLTFSAVQTRSACVGALRTAARTGRVPVLSHERLSGYPASGGYDAAAIADRLAAAFPGARVLIVIREQGSLLRSWYLQYLRDGGSLKLARYLNPPSDGPLRVPAFRYEFYEFDRLIRRYQTLFTPERVLVLPFELLKENPTAFLERIAAFAGLPAMSTPPARKRNVGLSPLWALLIRLGNWWLNPNQLSPAAPLEVPRLFAAYKRVASVIEHLAPNAVVDRADERLRRQIARRIEGRYGASNARTTVLTGLQLEAYGYQLDSGQTPPHLSAFFKEKITNVK